MLAMWRQNNFLLLRKGNNAPSEQVRRENLMNVASSSTVEWNEGDVDERSDGATARD
jgi:hypothetical protein